MAAEDWLSSSIMSKRALAKGKAGTTHRLTIGEQGGFHYVYGPYAKPTLSIDPGGIVVVETEDAFGGVLTKESDSPTAKLNFPYLNPQSGPIAVKGARKGDCLAVYIRDVETRGEQPADDLRQRQLLRQRQAGAVVTGALPPAPAAERALDAEKCGGPFRHSGENRRSPRVGSMGHSAPLLGSAT